MPIGSKPSCHELLQMRFETPFNIFNVGEV